MREEHPGRWVALPAAVAWAAACAASTGPPADVPADGAEADGRAEDVAAPDAEVFEGGDGECRPGWTLCGAACADLATDRDNCGACDRPCGPVEVCNEGVCAVACGGLERCGAACVDIGRDPANCGACGRRCEGALNADGVCELGECLLVCRAGWHDLDGLPGCESTCSPDPAGESCNGVDDDCDGETDEGFACAAGRETACTTTCATEGRGRCTAACTAPLPAACVPPPEICNGADDDCDTTPDDGFACTPGGAGSCATGCGSAGVRTCDEACAWGECAALPETCNGADDDCDGLTDEEPCPAGTYCGRGACRPPGCVPTCDGRAYGSSDGCGGSCHNLLSGTFLCISADCAGLSRNVTRAEWGEMLAELRAHGMWTVVLHAVGAVTCSTGCARSRAVTDAELGWALDEAAAAGVELYVGLYWCEESAPSWYWWSDPVRTECTNADVELVQQIESLYGLHPALRGYYVVQEAFVGLHDLALLDDFYPAVIAGIQSRAPGKRVIAGGYMFPYGPTPQTTAQIRDWTQRFLRGGSGVTGCAADVYLLQDGVGSFDTPLRSSTGSTVHDYLAAARDGAAPTPLWADIELFQWSATKTNTPTDNWYRPSNAIRVNEQLVAATDTSVRRIAWINQHHMSRLATPPDKRAEADHQFRGYRALYFGGRYYDSPSYAANPAPAASYPDPGGKLFDNDEGNGDWSRWVGWDAPSGAWLEITVDLGSPSPVTDASAVAMTDTGAAIFYPTTLEVLTSTDGSTFTPFGTFDNPYADLDRYSKVYLWVGSATPVTARWVRLRFRHGGWWLFLGELEVYSGG